jgi:hypothetical protein
MVRSWLALAVCLASCASGPRRADLDEDKPAPAVAPNPQGPFNPKAFAAQFGPGPCEQAARDLKATNPDAGWAVLNECLDKGFSSIRRLTDGAWNAELLSRKDAPIVLAKLIAARGGDVGGDLSALRHQRIVLLSLGAAMEMPKSNVGKLVLARIRADQLKEEGGRPSLAGVEVALSAAAKDGRTDGYRSGSSGFSSSYENPGGRLSRSSGLSTAYSGSSSGFDNAARETGRRALVHLVAADPYLEAGKQFVLLARFDGVRTEPAPNPDADVDTVQTALLTAVAYFEPAALVTD